MTLLVRVLLMVGGTAAYVGLAILPYGGPAAFFARPPLVALAMVMVAMAVAAAFAGGNVSPGVREDRANRWVIPALVLIGLADAVLPAWTDRIGLWTFGGDGVRWLGVLLCAAGTALRLGPVFVLGERFSGLVAIQPGHRLVTTGLYARIRHPSYLGLLVGTLGWGLAFRSGAGLLLTTLMLVPLVARIRAEEALLHAHFGAEYDSYRARTSRLLPGVY